MPDEKETVYIILDPKGRISAVFKNKFRMKALLYTWKANISEKYTYEEWTIR